MGTIKLILGFAIVVGVIIAGTQVIPPELANYSFQDDLRQVAVAASVNPNKTDEDLRTAVLNNLEFDHADIYPDVAAIRRQFNQLLRTVPASGLVIVNGEDAELAATLKMGCWTPRETFALNQGDWSARIAARSTRRARFLPRRSRALPPAERGLAPAAKRPPPWTSTPRRGRAAGHARAGVEAPCRAGPRPSSPRGARIDRARMIH